MEMYFDWKNRRLDDEDLSRELCEIEGNEKEIFDRFRCDLAFGTGGLRGLIGAGTNRMNIYTVGRATQGLADCLNMQNESGKELSVAIAYDSRNKGELFARRCASILVANGIKVYLYSELAPTPALSFAVRFYGCDAGICVTASHNPAVYNGYKVYDGVGCQIGPAMADVILAQMDKTDIFDGIKLADYDKAVLDGKIVLVDKEVFEAFFECVKGESLISDDVRNGEPLKIVYTPLNGAGRRSVMAVLGSESCFDITVVKAQEMPDGNFPTCPYPNPENPQALELALALCKKTDADLMIATDPDCDRCRIAAKDENGKYRALSGNEMGVLLLDYIAKRKTELGTLPENPVAVTTIVSTIMVDSIAKKYGIEMRRVLTGFKYIGEQIVLLENDGQTDRYLLGFEESCGYLSGAYVRDKDGVNAALLMSEMALYYKRMGKTLIDVLSELSKEHGYYKEDLMNFAFEGAEGAVKMQKIIEGLRNCPPAEIAGSKVVCVKDYHKSGLREGEYNDTTGLPDSNVLEFITENGCKVIIRPSGTEPKMKAYLFAVGKDLRQSEERLADIKNDSILKL